MAFLRGTSWEYHGNIMGISILDWDFPFFNHPAIMGYLHLWKPPYIFLNFKGDIHGNIMGI